MLSRLRDIFEGNIKGLVCSLKIGYIIDHQESDILRAPLEESEEVNHRSMYGKTSSSRRGKM